MNELVSLFTEKHLDVAGLYLARIKSLLEQESNKVITYAADSSGGWCDRESIKIEIDPKTTITIDLVRSK